MPTKLVLGLQHGDEGKGRVVDDIAEEWADVVVRFQGGGNAGHTVYDREGNKYVTHILPVGVLNKNVLNIVARGCVLNIKDLHEEIKEFDNITNKNLLISGYCPLIEPTHIQIDRDKYQSKLGTTARGIGPAYSAFYARDSILFKDLVEDPRKCYDIIVENYFAKYPSISDKNIRFITTWLKDFFEIVDYLSEFIMSDESTIQDLYDEGKNILLEGAQGCGLNIHSNNYPDVTSSAPTVGGALNSTGLNHNQLDEVIGVMKAYKTKVGTGDFPSRCDEKSEKVLMSIGQEYGATTGRPRKCGWLDLDEINSAIQMNGIDHLCLIKTDVFTNIEEPKVFYQNRLIDIPRINHVNTNDESFKTLLKLIKDKTGVNRVSYTTGPTRGEIVWHV